jgi:hypothetical protein
VRDSGRLAIAAAAFARLKDDVITYKHQKLSRLGYRYNAKETAQGDVMTSVSDLL